MSYVNKAVDKDSRKDLLSKIKKNLRSLPYRIDAVAGMGTSGLLVAPSIADRLDCYLIALRKPGTSTHTSDIVEFDPILQDKEINYIIIDDLIASGSTITTIKREIAERGSIYTFRNLSAGLTPPAVWTCLGTYLYNSHVFEPLDRTSKNIEFK